MASEFHESELGVSATLILPADYHIEDSDHRIASELPSGHGSRTAPLELEKPEREFRTIWNRDHLKFRDHLRLVEGCGNSTSCRKEVPAKAKVIRQKFPKKMEEIRQEAPEAMKTPLRHGLMKATTPRTSVKCAGITVKMTPTSSDATAQMEDSLPAQQQRRRMSTPWLYRHWLFKQVSPLSTFRRAKKCC
ncbi:hypothetical protein Aduo_003800 [Ancylostoma duodenale]